MAKDTFYFSHDYNARTDVKIRNLIYKKGYEGYGVYWALIEDLYQNNNRIPYDLEVLCHEYRVNLETIKSIINDFGLFQLIDDCITSDSIGRRLDMRSGKTKKGRESANKRWDDGKSYLRKKAENCILYIIKIFNSEEVFIKVGITSDSVSRRFSGKLKRYSYELMFSQECEISTGCEIENAINANYSKYSPKQSFAGSLECYNATDLQSITSFAMQQFSFRNAIKESKVKESKVKEIINKESEEKIGEVFFRINDQIFLMPPSEYFKSNFPGFFEQWIIKNGNELSGPAFEKMDTEYFGYTFADINHIRRTFITCWNKCRNVKKSFAGKPPDNKMTAVLDAYQSSAKKLGL